MEDDATAIRPVFYLADDGGTNYLNEVYRHRIHRDSMGLTYAVGSTTNLTAGRCQYCGDSTHEYHHCCDDECRAVLQGKG